MAKKHKPKKRKTATSTRRAPSRVSVNYQDVFLRVLGFARPLIFLAVIWALVAFNKGYARLYQYNYVQLIEQLHKYKGLTYEEKLGKFLPQDYAYLNFVKEKTPEDAVLLGPPANVWNPKDKKLGFSRWMWRKDYTTYFLYPRKVLYDVPQDRDNPLMEQITHVMIVDSWGYDKLNYTVSNPQALTVLPIHQ